MTTWRLGRRPALDGLRGVAVLLVLVGHAGVPWMPDAGNVGVTVFFALSGFLITSLLLDERAEGAVDVRGFYVRRARRLLPALAVLLFVVAAIDVYSPGYVALPMLAGAAGFVANWVTIGHYTDWGPLNHTWSLAVEEQFYLVWPLLLLRLPRRAVGWILAAACIGPIMLRIALEGDYLRAYAGTDCRLDSLAIGCALAFAVRRGFTLPGWVTVFGAVAIAWATQTSQRTDLIASPLLVAAAAAVVIAATLDGSRLLATPVLRYVGRRSYAIYLWHYPLAAAFVGTSIRWEVRLVVLLVASMAAAEVSWRLVEKPCRSGHAGDAPDELVRRDVLGRRSIGRVKESDVGGGQRLRQVRGALDPGNTIA